MHSCPFNQRCAPFNGYFSRYCSCTLKKLPRSHSWRNTKETAVKTLESCTQTCTLTLTLWTQTPLRVKLPETCLCVLKMGLVECYTSAEAAGGQLTVRRRELGGKDHVAVRVDWANLTQHRHSLGHALLELSTVLIEGQQTYAVPVWRADKATVRAKAQFLDVATAHVGLLDVMREPQRAAGRDRQPRWSSLLKLVHACPLQGGNSRTVSKAVSSALHSYAICWVYLSHYIKKARPNGDNSHLFKKNSILTHKWSSYGYK